MTTCTDLNDLLNLIKIRFRYLEWKLSIATTDEETNVCFEELLEVTRELSCILNLENLSEKDKLTTLDYLTIISSIVNSV